MSSRKKLLYIFVIVKVDKVERLKVSSFVMMFRSLLFSFYPSTLVSNCFFVFQSTSQLSSRVTSSFLVCDGNGKSIMSEGRNY